MTSRERLTAAARGWPVDYAPWFAWSPDTPERTALDFAKACNPDAVVVESAIDAQQILAENTDVAVLVEVLNPFGAALEAGVNLNTEYEAGREHGEALFSAYAAGVESSLMAAIESGADGVLYRLIGAEPELSSPMQFGGRFLEHERELLSTVEGARFNVVYVEGSDAYLDFLSDLPASAFGWDDVATSLPVQEVRRLTQGAVACGLLGDPRSLWEEMLGIGIIFSAKVDSLVESEFTATKHLMEELTTIYV